MIVNFVVGFVVAAAGTNVIVINVHCVIVLSVNVRTHSYSQRERKKNVEKKEEKIGRSMTSFLYAPK
jgi:hypothetical protein